MNRNLVLARSVLFGAVTKLAGSGMILIGLPLVANALPGPDYATFLASMSVSSFVTLWFGATVSLSVRELAQAIASGDAGAVAEAENSAAGLFVVSVLTSGIIAMATLLFSTASGPQRAIFLFVDCLALIHGLMLWNDAYRIALRSDHVSSMWQLGGAIVTIGMLTMVAHQGLWPVVLVYFGGPFITQTCMLTHLWFERRFSIKVRLSPRMFLRHLRLLFPLVVNSFAEYARIFGSSLIVIQFFGQNTYARYATIVLFIARLTNPLSLFTRPLMPAFIDAIHHGDTRWLNTVVRLLIVAAVLGLIAGMLTGAMIPVSYLTWVVPEKIGGMDRAEIVISSLYLWGLAIISVMIPFYLARNQSGLYSTINTVFIVAGLIVGSLSMWHGYEDGMLIAISGATALTAITLVLWAVLRLFVHDGDAMAVAGRQGATTTSVKA